MSRPIAAIIMSFFLITSAQAHVHHRLNRGHHVVPVPAHHWSGHHRHYRGSVAVMHDGRPSAWCGWYMRQLKGGGPELNLARNWARVGSPSAPQIGAVV